jgi:PAN domain
MLKTTLVFLFSLFIATSAMAKGGGDFIFEDNTTHPGGDFKNLGTADVHQCARECGRDSRCLSFSYDKVKQMCWLKNSVPAIEHNRDIISGVKNPNQQGQGDYYGGGNAMGMFHVAQNTTLPGSDYTNFASNDVNHCAKQCANEPRCRAFAYDKVKRTCWLKDRVPQMEHNRDITAGVKR